jgi:hypothetical protein
VNTPRRIGMPYASAERNTRMPDTGSLRERMTTSTRAVAASLKASSLCTSEKATPGFAAASSRSSCSFM